MQFSMDERIEDCLLTIRALEYVVFTCFYLLLRRYIQSEIIRNVQKILIRKCPTSTEQGSDCGFIADSAIADSPFNFKNSSIL
jgi:hypothetical protein